MGLFKITYAMTLHLNGWSKFQVTCGCMDFSSATLANKAKNRLMSYHFSSVLDFSLPAIMTSEEISKARMNEKIRRPTRCMQIFRLDSSRHCPINVITRLLHFKISLIILFFFTNKKENF